MATKIDDSYLSDWVIELVKSHHLSAYSDVLSILTAFITLVGFLWTFWSIKKTKDLIKTNFVSKHIISDGNYAIFKMKEMKTSLEEGKLKNALALCEQIITLLSLVMLSGFCFNDRDKSDLSKCENFFKQNEKNIRNSILKNAQIDVAKINNNLSDKSHTLHALLIRIRNEV